MLSLDGVTRRENRVRLALWRRVSLSVLGPRLVLRPRLALRGRLLWLLPPLRILRLPAISLLLVTRRTKVAAGSHSHGRWWRTCRHIGCRLLNRRPGGFWYFVYGGLLFSFIQLVRGYFVYFVSDPASISRIGYPIFAFHQGHVQFTKNPHRCFDGCQVCSSSSKALPLSDRACRNLR